MAARERVGYLPGELSLYDNMRARRFFKMYHSLQKSDADPSYWQTLADRLDLDTSRKIGSIRAGTSKRWGWWPPL